MGISTKSRKENSPKILLNKENEVQHIPKFISEKHGKKKKTSPKKLKKVSLQDTLSESNHEDEVLINRIIATKMALNGGFGVYDSKLWTTPIWTLCIYVSSTLTDTYIERNILQHLTTILRHYGRKNNIEVLFVDMRYGLYNQYDKNQNVWFHYERELRRCYEKSCGLFFLSLQSSKYGYMPLPPMISRESYMKLCHESDEVAQIAEKWFQLDENSIPPRYRLLQSNGNDNSDFHAVMPILRNALIGQPMVSCGLDSRLLIGCSVSEWELRTALSLGKSRCLWSHRVFSDLPPISPDHSLQQTETTETNTTADVIEELVDEVPDLTDYRDTQEPSIKLKYDELLSTMERDIPAENIMKFNVTLEDYKKCSVDTGAYSIQWADTIKQRLLHEMDAVVKQKEEWDKNGLGVMIAGRELQEMLSHLELANSKSQCFVGREDLIKTAMQMLYAEQKVLPETSAHVRNIQRLSSPRNEDPTNPFGICFCVVGRSGAGKTALMARLAEEAFEEEFKIWAVKSQALIPYKPPPVERVIEKRNICEGLRRPVIIRFCGTTVGSSDGFSLVQSLVRQMRYLFDVKDGLIPSTFDEATKELHKLLHNYAVILFIDSLDQLTDMNLARSRISFLKGCKPHKDTRIIVSALPDERDESGKVIYWYGCDTTLAASHVPRLNVPFFEVAYGAEERGGTSANRVLEFLLSPKYRRLTSSQWSTVLDMVDVEPTALYLNLACRVIQHWKSSDESVRLEPGVVGIINQIFDYVEEEYGYKFCRLAFGVITYSCYGVTNNEMLDMLSLDDDVLEDLFQDAKPHVYRVPSHIWLRLREDMEGLILEGDGECFSWYHRQLQETAEIRYADIKCKVHALLGNYFLNNFDPTFHVSRQISQQQLTLTPECIWMDVAVINNRRCSEGAHHLIEAGLYMEAIDELCNFEVICAAAKCGEGFRTISRLTRLMQLVMADKGVHVKVVTRVEHYVKWLAESMHAILEFPVVNIFVTACGQPLESIVRKEMLVYLSERRQNHGGIESFKSNSWVQCVALGCSATFGPRRSVLLGHTDVVWSVAWSPDGNKIASGSNDSIVGIWDPATGERLLMLEKHADAVNCVAWNATSTLIASASRDNTVCVWDICAGGAVCGMFEGHTDEVNSVCWSPAGDLIVSGSEDRSVCVWHPCTGALDVSFKEHIGGVDVVAWSPCGRKIVSSSRDTLSVFDVCSHTTLYSYSIAGVHSLDWNPDSFELVMGLEDHIMSKEVNKEACFDWKVKTDVVWSIAYCPDGSRVASGSKDALLKMWDPIIGQEMYTLKVHTDSVRCVSWNPDGRMIATSSSDNTICIVDTTVGDLDPRSTVHTDVITCVQWSPDGKKIASASVDGTIRIWNSTQYLYLLSLEGHTRGVTAVSWCTNSHQLASRSRDKTIRVWDTNSGKELGCTTVGLVAKYSIAWSPDGSTISWISQELSLSMWKFASDEVPVVITIDSWCEYPLCTSTDEMVSRDYYFNLVKSGESVLLGQISSVTCSPDGKIATGFLFVDQWSIRISNETGKKLRTWPVCEGEDGLLGAAQANAKVVLAWSADGTKLASGDMTNKVLIWNSNSASVALKIKLPSSGVKCLSWNYDNTMLACGIAESVSLINPASGVVLRTLQGHNGDVTSLCWKPKSHSLATGSSDKTIRIWDAASGEVSAIFEGHTSCVNSVCWHPDGTLLASGSSDNSICLWNDGDVVCTLNGHYDDVIAVAFSPGGSMLASASKDSTCRVWDTSNSNLKAVYVGHTESVNFVSWSPEGNHVISGSDDKTFSVWCPDVGVKVKSFSLNSLQTLRLSVTEESRPIISTDGNLISIRKRFLDTMRCLSWSPDCKTLAIGVSGGDLGFVCIVDNAGTEKATWATGTDHVQSIAYSPNGQMIATGSHDNSVGVWDAVSGASLWKVQCHTGSVNCVAWSLDSLMVASASNDSCIRICDASNGQLKSTLRGHSGAVNSVSWSHESDCLVSGSSDTSVYVWISCTGANPKQMFAL